MGKISRGTGKIYDEIVDGSRIKSGMTKIMKKIFAIILNCNGFDDTFELLQTIHLLNDKSYSLSIVIIDNGSNSEELLRLQEYLKNKPKIKLIENKKNLGFAKANNIGIRFVLDKGADYVLLLNNDTKIETDFVKRLIEINASISSPAVKFRERQDRPKMVYDLGGHVNWWTGRTHHLNVDKESLKNYVNKGPINADYIAGCCMLIKKEVFETIGLLDEKYFIYFEDVDFCITAKKQGFTVIVDPGSIIYHTLGGYMGRWSSKTIINNLFSNFIFISKHLGVRRITAYAYLFILTLKIIKDRLFENLVSYNRTHVHNNT